MGRRRQLRASQALRKDHAILLHHLGLGDHLVCNGLVRAYIRRHSLRRCFLPCKIHNLTTVQFMYRDLSELTVVPVRDFPDARRWQPMLNCPLVEVGFSRTRLSDWDVSFYDDAGIPFASRWEDFHVVRDTTAEEALFRRLNPDGAPFALIHDESSSGRHALRIDAGLLQIRVEREQTSNLFDYGLLIQRAVEMHCINSALIHLVESLGTSAHCYYHDANYGSPDGFSRRLPWQTVCY